MSASERSKPVAEEIPRGTAAGFLKYIKQDALSGFLVFLIALPLCLGISLACGYPPMAGIFTAIIGAILTTFISDSELTIKGPAAGLIVIAMGCIKDFGGTGFVGIPRGTPDFDISMSAYQAALAVGVAAAALQIVFGLFRAGILSEFFPTSAVHGMLAAIGVIIIAKQLPTVVGVQADPDAEPLELLTKIPEFLMEANPAIAIIGGVSLLIMFLWPLVKARVSLLKVVPAPLVVVLVAVPLGMGFDLLHEHSFELQGHKYQLGEQYLVSMPDQIFGMFNEMTFPDFSALGQPIAWKWVCMFFIIGTLESVLSSKAVDIIDPWKRETSMDRDILAVGVANLSCALVGGLPMISEIVRSKANIDNGARTRFADMWHGVFLLVCVALIPTVLHLIPLAALAAMLVYTGYRLAHPSEFVHIYQIGREQLVIFVTTLIAVLATDLLIGIAIGICLKLLIHVMNGVPVKALFKTYLDVEPYGKDSCLIRAHESAVFSNWIPFRRQLEDIGLIQRQNIILDLSDVKLIDHTVMDKLHELGRQFEQEGVKFEMIGLDVHVPLAEHEYAARKKGLVKMRRIVVIAEETLEEQLEREMIARGASGFTAIPCRGAGRRHLNHGDIQNETQVRIEVIVPQDVAEEILVYLRAEILPEYHVTACVETVEAIRPEQFVSRTNNSGNGTPTDARNGRELVSQAAGHR